MTSRDSDDPRAKYRQLPPDIDLTNTVESVAAATDVPDEADANEGARPYLRMTFGPWVG